MNNETQTARQRAEALFNEHGVKWRGYDGENLMSLAVEFMEPELLREMMRLYKEKGYDPVAALQKGDNDGITGMSMALDVPDLLPVLEEFGVECFRPKLLPAIPAESSDVYDVYKAEVADGTRLPAPRTICTRRGRLRIAMPLMDGRISFTRRRW